MKGIITGVGLSGAIGLAIAGFGTLATGNVAAAVVLFASVGVSLGVSMCAIVGMCVGREM